MIRIFRNEHTLSLYIHPIVGFDIRKIGIAVLDHDFTVLTNYTLDV